MTSAIKRDTYTREAVERAFDGRFRNLVYLGAGGFGAVFRAYDKERADIVALKFTLAVGDPGRRVRFDREFKILLAGGHPALVRVYDSGEAQIEMSDGHQYNHLWYTMEYCSGGSVRQKLTTMGLVDRVTIAMDLLDVLSFVHTSGIAHRDIKPDNMFLLEGGLKIGDFGIAKELRTADSVTPPGLIMGDFRYLAPERWKLSSHDWRPSDQYAAGITIYQILSRGRFPLDFKSRDAVDYVDAHCNGQYLRIAIPEFPERSFAGIDEVLRQMTAKELSERYPGTRVCKEELDTALLRYSLSRRDSSH